MITGNFVSSFNSGYIINAYCEPPAYKVPIFMSSDLVENGPLREGTEAKDKAKIADRSKQTNNFLI